MHTDKMITKIYKDYGTITHNSFSICLHHHHNSNDKGYLTLGGVNPAIHHDHNIQMQFTNLIANPNGWYVIHIHDVYIGTKSLSSSSSSLHHQHYLTGHNNNNNNANFIRNAFNTKERGTIIDSGTTDIYLPASIASIFIHLWQYYTQIPYTNDPIELSYDEYSKIPNITLKILNNNNDADADDDYLHWVIQPKYYL